MHHIAHVLLICHGQSAPQTPPTSKKKTVSLLSHQLIETVNQDLWRGILTRTQALSPDWWLESNKWLLENQYFPIK